MCWFTNTVWKDVYVLALQTVPCPIVRISLNQSTVWKKRRKKKKKKKGVGGDGGWGAVRGGEADLHALVYDHSKPATSL